MIALYNFTPTYCPFCGEKILVKWNVEQMANWYAHLTHACPCGVQFQYVKTRHLVEAGAQEGNLALFHPEVKESEKMNPMGHKYLCVICLKHPVEAEHVICRVCNEKMHVKLERLSEPERSRLYAELEYRYRQDNPEKVP